MPNIPATIRDVIDALPTTMTGSRKILERLAPFLSSGTKSAEDAVKDLADTVPVLIGAIIGIENRLEVLEGRPTADITGAATLIAQAIASRHNPGSR